jgi:hypothetical protein
MAEAVKRASGRAGHGWPDRAFALRKTPRDPADYLEPQGGDARVSALRHGRKLAVVLGSGLVELAEVEERGFLER